MAPDLANLVTRCDIGDRPQTSQDVAVTVCSDSDNSVTCVTSDVTCCVYQIVSLCLRWRLPWPPVTRAAHCSNAESLTKTEKLAWERNERNESNERNEFEHMTTMKAPFFQDLVNNVGMRPEFFQMTRAKVWLRGCYSATAACRAQRAVRTGQEQSNEEQCTVSQE